MFHGNWQFLNVFCPAINPAINRIEMRRAESYASPINSKMDFSRLEWLVALTASGMKPVASVEPDNFSVFVRHQPEHVEIAGALGLGVWEEGNMDVRRVELKA